MTRGFFVTGTDTGVGKTLVSCALIHALKARGVAVHPFKPIAAGATESNGSWMNDDTRDLMQAAELDAGAAPLVTPVLLRDPMAPHIAATREGRQISLDPVRDAFARLGPYVVAEGVGGFMVPLGDGLDSVDLCRALELPVVMVVGMRLGCLNHALLTARAIEAANFHLAGWVANAIDPAMLVPDENLATLEARIDAPLLGRLPHQSRPDARALARLLNVEPLL